MPLTSKSPESQPELEHAQRLFREHQLSIYKRTDRLFAALISVQWVVAVVIALLMSSNALNGASGQMHPHVWAALFLGGVISIIPAILGVTRPGARSTRYTIAVAQMLMGAVLIHVTGGRIETHFHIFASLAFLAFYRDWRLLVTASVVVVADHLLRDLFWPYSVYGVLTTSGWRTVEHAMWLACADIFLIISCLQIKRDMWNQALQSANRKVSDQRHRQLADVIQGTGVTSNLDELLGLIHRAIGKVLYAENFYVALYDQQTAMIEMQFFVDQYDEQPPPHAMGQSRTAYVFRTGRPALITNDVLKRLLEEGEVESFGTPPASWLGIPLETSSAIIGVLVVQHYLDPNAYSERDLNFLTSVASQIAMAIERKQAEEALRESEERYRDLFENANDIIYTHDLLGNYTSVNKASEKITGYTAAESVGMNVMEVVAPDYLDITRQMLNKKVGRKGPSAYEVQIIAKDGSRITLETNSRLVSQNGVPCAVQGIARDITERKRAEAERQVISEIVTGIITTSNLSELLTLIHNSISKILYAENCYVALYDNQTGLLHLPLCIDKYDPVAPSMKLGNGLTAYVLRSADSLLLKQPDIQELMAQGEIELIGTLPAIWLGVPLRTPAATVGVLVVQHYEDEHAYSPRDLEFLSAVGDQIALAIESKRMEERLRESEEKYRTILESIEDGYFEVDLGGTYTYLNDSYCRITERSVEEMLGHSYKEFFDADLSLRLFEAYAGVYESGEPIRAFEYAITRKDGTKKFVEESVTLKRNAAGEITGFMGIRRDCTERKRIGVELERARDAALESVRLKSEFLANMSHEIRTPMNGVIGMTGLLLDTELDREQREFAETIQSSGDALLTIINDILDFSKIEAGKLHFESLDFNLVHAVGGAIELLAERAITKNIELVSSIDSDVTTHLQGDPGRLRQVLTNLLGNAIKFTDHGNVILRVEMESETDNDTVIRFTIGDTGIGIEGAAQQRLFQAFTQADGSTTRKYGGTGLGLAISKQLVDLMGGEIGVESVPGQGSSFWFTAEFGKQSGQSREFRLVAAGLGDLEVLIIDDNATSRTVLSHQLSSWGMSHDESDCASEGLALLRSRAVQNNAYDLAIIDLVMPELDSFELVRRIKADPVIAATRLVLLTSAPGEGPAPDADAGVAAYLTKPIRQSQLLDCLTNIFNHAAVTLEEESQETSSLSTSALKETIMPPHKLILLAEDNIVNQKVAILQLQKLGYVADAVANGRQAVEALEKIPYDVILMDCQMPELDGYEATAEIRRREGTTKHTAIVAMTANALEGDRGKCLAAGMDDYISKPVKSDELARVLDRVFAESAESKELDVYVAAEVASPVDMNRLHESMGEELFDILDIYMEQTSENLKKLTAAIGNGNIAEVNMIAHNCAGTSANCGMLAVLPPLRELERMSREGCLDGAEVLDQQLASEFQRIRVFLNENLEPLAV